ncbi:MAG: SapC family protein, partial [Rubrivivax sp.]
ALVKADLLTEMRFDATLPDGKTLTVDGFLAVDEKKFAALSDDKVLELHKNGALGLIHAHQISLRHMRRLVQWRQERAAAAPSA